MADLDAILTSAEAGELLGITATRLRQLVDLGHVEKGGRNGVVLRAAVQGYIGFLKDDSRRSSKSAAASRMQDAKTREIDLRIAEREGRLVDIVELNDIVAAVVGELRTGLSGVPAAVTNDTAQRLRIETSINAVLTAAADRFEQEAASLRAGGSSAEADAADDA